MNPNGKNPGSTEQDILTSLNKFASISRSLGILALVFMFLGIIYGAMICGGLAIILAILSRGYSLYFIRPAIAGLVCGCIAVIGETLLIFVGIYSYIFVPEIRQQINQQYQQIYEQFYGEDLPVNPFENLFNNTDIPRVEGGEL